MRIAIALLSLVLASQATAAFAQANSKQETAFGIEVARKGLWKEARFRFERAVELDPENASALNNLAIALEQQGDFDDARKNYERALDLDPDNLYIQQNYDLFREADDKRRRKTRKRSRSTS